MRVRRLDTNGDYRFGHQQSDFWLNAPEGVAQVIQQRLQFWKGEWFLDITDGTPWLDQVLGKYAERTRTAVLRERILGTQGVLALTSFSSVANSANRTFTLNATVSTSYGATTITK